MSLPQWTGTQADVERWINELGQECDKSEWAEGYKFGWGEALTAVISKMDDDRRRQKRAAEV